MRSFLCFLALEVMANNWSGLNDNLNCKLVEEDGLEEVFIHELVQESKYEELPPKNQGGSRAMLIECTRNAMR